MDNSEYRLKDFHASYIRRGGRLQKKEFKNIIQTFNKLLLDSLIEGYKLKLGYGLGILQICRFERNFKKPVPNWEISNQIKKQLLEEGKTLFNKDTGEGHKWIVYYTDPYYYGFLWTKATAKFGEAGYRTVLHNVRYYDFVPFARTRRKVAASINEESISIYEFKPSLDLKKLKERLKETG